MFDSKFPVFENYYARAVTFLKENRAAMFALIGLLTILLVQFIILPVYKYNRNLSRQEQLAASELAKIKNLSEQYLELKKVVHGSGPKQDSRNLFAKLENLTRKLNVTANVDFMRPSTKKLKDGRIVEDVYIRFKNILQRQFVEFLYRVEFEGGLVTVKHLRLKKNKHKNFDIDLILTKADG